MNMIEGPFGSYDHGSLGAILNAAVRIEKVPLHKVESFQCGDSQIKVGETVVGFYKWFDGIDQPLFMWTNEEYRAYSQHQLVIGDDKKLKVKFRLTLCTHMSPAIEVSGELATPGLHYFLSGMLTNWTLDPRYAIHQEAGAFFQGGSHDPNGKWFLIEFWNPKGTKAFVDYMNEHYDPEKELEE